MIRARRLEVELGGRAVLRGVDFALAPGEMVAVVGPNGAGKSTLLRALVALVPLLRGSVRIGDRELPELSRRALARRVAFLPQAHEALVGFRVREIVEMGRYPHVGPLRALGAADRSAVDRALARCDLLGFEERPVHALSGGERQRVWVARALASEAPALLLDEPGAGLDIRHALELLSRLHRHAREGGAVGVALHDLALAVRFCDRVLLLDGGALAAQGAPLEVLESEAARKAFGVRFRGLAAGARTHLVWDWNEEESHGD